FHLHPSSTLFPYTTLFRSLRMPTPFRVDAPFKPAGDQPQAIAELVEGVRAGLSQQVLAGVTGSGKTNVMAWAVEQLQRPVLVLRDRKSTRLNSSHLVISYA